tara:strand:+ start:284 stop:496 length:213 start_codon:yes stop_codon:yes gene_type:complete
MTIACFQPGKVAINASAHWTCRYLAAILKVAFPRERYFETPPNSIEGYTTTVDRNLLTNAAAHIFLVVFS